MPDQEDHGDVKSEPAGTEMPAAGEAGLTEAVRDNEPDDGAAKTMTLLAVTQEAALLISSYEVENPGPGSLEPGTKGVNQPVVELPVTSAFESEVITIVLQLLPQDNKAGEAHTPSRTGLLSIRYGGDAPLFGPLLRGPELEELTNVPPVARLIGELKAVLSRRPAVQLKPGQPDKATTPAVTVRARTSRPEQVQSDGHSAISQTILPAAVNSASQPELMPASSQPASAASANEAVTTVTPKQLSMF